jgi:hypothetical protein
MAILFTLVGALIPTFLVSRVFLWVLKRWDTGWTRLATANVLSLLGLAGLAGWRAADGGPFVADAGVVYILPQAIWFGIDAWRHRRTAASLAAGERSAP